MILILGGTSDSLAIAEELIKEHSVILSVATEAGRTSSDRLKNQCRIAVGRKDAEELKVFIEENHINLVVDATHPYAVIASENAEKAAKEVGIPYLRYSRPGAEKQEKTAPLTEIEAIAEAEFEIIWVKDYKAAAAYVEDKDGVIFSTLGSKNIQTFTDQLSDKRRVIARILPDVDSIKGLLAAGIGYDQIIAMKGPFSVEMNRLMMKEKKAAFLLTKDSGKAGGFMEKLEAAKELGIKIIVIKRNEEEKNAKAFTELQDLYKEVKAILK